MCKFNLKNDSRRIDPCMKPLIRFLKKDGWEIIACCCGHNKYPMTLIAQDDLHEYPYELLSNTIIERLKRFYKKDKQGYYYIPETLKE